MSNTEEVVDPNDIDLNVDDFNKVIENSTGLNVKKVDDKCPSKDQEPKTPSNTKEYKKQALVFHPDRNPGCVEDATKKFQTLENYNNDLTKNNTQPKEMGQTNELTAPEPEHKYITIFNDLVKDNDNKLLTNEKFEQAVKDNFGDNVNIAEITASITNSSSTSNNIDLETFTKNMEKIEELSKKSAVETNTAAVETNTAAVAPTAAPTAAAHTFITDTNNNSTATADNAVYAIIQIDSEKKITVLDAMPDGQNLNTSVSPYDLLANKTESVFAVKIVKKDNCDGATDQIKCISFGNSHYELDLTTAVAAVGKLLEQDFLSNIAHSKGDGSESVDSKDSTPKFKEGDTINYDKKNITIKKILKNADGKLIYDTTIGEINSEIVDKDGDLVILSHGGSRKNRGQQSKKTKRKYYVYRK